SFPFTVLDAAGRTVANRELQTRAPGGIGASTVMKLDPGRYRISERLPLSATGEWKLDKVTCNGNALAPGKPVSVQITAGSAAPSTFTNRLDLVGEINVAGVSLGGLGSAWYVSSPKADAATQRRQLASTSRQGVPAAARGQSTHGIPFGSYVIAQSAAL